jgi:exosortase A-associated hydrolase 1
MTALIEQAVVFDCAGEQCLGLVHEAQSSRSTVGVLVIVGGPQYRVGSHRQFVHLARDLAASGYPVFRFDYRGMGDSTGEARDFRAVSRDIRAAVDTFLERVPRLRSVVLFGLCDAASAALLYCGSDSRLAGLILANPWVRTPSGLARAHVKHYYRSRFLHGSFWRKLASGRLDLLSSVRGFARAIGLSLRQPSAAPPGESESDFLTGMRLGLAEFKRPVLFLLSGRDLTAREFTDLCAADGDWGKLIGRPTVCRTTFDEADHTFSSATAARDVSQACAKWLSGIFT